MAKEKASERLLRMLVRELAKLDDSDEDEPEDEDEDFLGELNDDIARLREENTGLLRRLNEATKLHQDESKRCAGYRTELDKARAEFHALKRLSSEGASLSATIAELRLQLSAEQTRTRVAYDGNAELRKQLEELRRDRVAARGISQ